MVHKNLIYLWPVFTLQTCHQNFLPQNHWIHWKNLIDSIRDGASPSPTIFGGAAFYYLYPEWRIFQEKIFGVPMKNQRSFHIRDRIFYIFAFASLVPASPLSGGRSSFVRRFFLVPQFLLSLLAITVSFSIDTGIVTVYLFTRFSHFFLLPFYFLFVPRFFVLRFFC